MSKIKKSKPQAKCLNWEQEYVAKHGQPEIIRLSPLDIAWLTWGKAQCYSAQDEGARA